MEKFNLIFLEDKLLLSAKKYNSWTEIQDEYDNYKSSLDFESLKDIQDYIEMDYKLEKEFAESIINKFIESKLTVMPLEF
jgi:hypothetical protein